MNLTLGSLLIFNMFCPQIEYVEESQPTDLGRARYLLQLWSEENPECNPESLAVALEQAGFPAGAAVVNTFL